MNYKKVVSEILANSGITVNGNQSFDIQIKDERTYKKLLAQGNLGLGESYMEGWWTCESIDELSNKMLRSGLNNMTPNFGLIMAFLQAKLTNKQSLSRSSEVCIRHYDLGNDLFIKMLDPLMVYTCGYWDNANNLEEAQIAKLRLTVPSGYEIKGVGK